MEKESVELVLQHLDKLGEKLGVGVERIWPWFVHQVYIESIVSLFLMLFSMGLFVSLSIFVAKHWKKREGKYSIDDSSHEPPWVIGLVLLGIVTLICTIAFFTVGFNFLNPEYHAFKNILATVK
jgi:hypothetical protein